MSPGIRAREEKGLALECALHPGCVRLFSENRPRREGTETGRITVEILPEGSNVKESVRTSVTCLKQGLKWSAGLA